MPKRQLFGLQTLPMLKKGIFCEKTTIFDDKMTIFAEKCQFLSKNE